MTHIPSTIPFHHTKQSIFILMELTIPFFPRLHYIKHYLQVQQKKKGKTSSNTMDPPLLFS